MARKARVVAPGIPHHVTQRGNNRQKVFRSDDDRRFYLDTLRAKCALHGVSLLGYCLLSNHVHLIAVPQRPDSLAQVTCPPESAHSGSSGSSGEFGSSGTAPPY